MPETPRNLLLAWALRYVKLGWPVLPLWPHDAKNAEGEKLGKVPHGRLVPHGSKQASLNESVIREWWKQEPRANVGLATHHAFFVVDVDIERNGDSTWEMWKYQHGNLPNTVEQITGKGGKHILYALPDFQVRNSKDKIGPGIDIRGIGGYIVAAPSIHPDTGREYSWDGMAPVWEQTIAPAPSWLLELIQKAETRTDPVPKVEKKIPKGQRHNTLVSIAGTMRRRGLSAEEIFALLKVTNQTRCEEPYDEPHIRKIAESISQYPPDARYSVFRMAAKEPAAEPATPVEELPLAAADVEAAVDDAIAKNDLQGAIKLHAEIARLTLPNQVWFKAKLKLGFKDFPSRDFERLLKEAAGQHGIPEPPDLAGQAEAAGGAAGPDLTFLPLTDSGNGERIVQLFGAELRFCVEMDKWLVWDGRRWAVDECQVATQKAKQMCRLLYAQAATIVDGGRRKTLEKHARDSESQGGITAALKRAATEKTIPIHATELDQHPYLLNCLNGVIDLRKGELLPHDRGYLITKLCHVNYNPEAKAHRFLKFLYWAMGQNPEADVTERTVRMLGFLQRCFGYALTGDVSERAVIVFYGAKGRNGKTTLLTLFRKVLGEYSTQIKITTLMAAHKNQGDSADLADLFGSRLAVTSETEEEHKLSEGQLKYLTAGPDAPIKIRRLYENYIEFIPTHTLFMDCNHRPKINGTDDAIWDRLKCVQFDMRIAKEDPEFDRHLGEKLLAEAEGVLAWAVRGAVGWKAQGLGDPPEISQATLEWRQHDDTLKKFLEDCCETNIETIKQPDGLWVRASELSQCYSWWCKENRVGFGLGGVKFTDRMIAKGFEESRSHRGPNGKQFRAWLGLQIKPEVWTELKADGRYKSSLLED